MANHEHLEILARGVETWNRWRYDNPEIKPDISGANLSGRDLGKANLRFAEMAHCDLSNANCDDADVRHARLQGSNLRNAQLKESDLLGAGLQYADLCGASLRFAWLISADLSNAKLAGADLCGTTLHNTILRNADLSDANLQAADINGSDFAGTDLSRADLMYARLIETNFDLATLLDCAVYGVSAWNLRGTPKEQSNLNIAGPNDPTITVDNLEVAQFIYMLLNNNKIRDVINTITTKAVLILGRFTPQRKAILDAVRAELHKHNYLPILFDFDRPLSRNLTETVSTLAHMARFVIADLTEAKSIPQELQRIVPSLPSVPIQPILLSSEHEYGMFIDFADYPWVLMPYRYDCLASLIVSLEEMVIAPAETKARQIEARHQDLASPP